MTKQSETAHSQSGRKTKGSRMYSIRFPWEIARQLEEIQSEGGNVSAYVVQVMKREVETKVPTQPLGL